MPRLIAAFTGALARACGGSSRARGGRGRRLAAHDERSHLSNSFHPALAESARSTEELIEEAHRNGRPLRFRSDSESDGMRLPARLAALVLAVGVLSAPSPRAVGGQSGEGWDADTPRVPAIERLAPGAFDPGVRARAEAHVTYRIDATVRLPLLLGSIPLADRVGVGVASVRVRDLAVRAAARRPRCVRTSSSRLRTRLVPAASTGSGSSGRQPGSWTASRGGRCSSV